MAKKKNSVTLPEFKEVIQVSLTESMVDQVVAYAARKSDILLAIQNLPVDGYILTVGPNPLGGVTASLRDANTGSVNAGLMFYGNAPDTLGAIATCLVKLDFLSTGTSWKEMVGENEQRLYR